jgi:protein-S-isoprenylcysteine O-methyltransferase Ste14
MADENSTESKPGLLAPAYFLFCWLGGIGLHFVVPIARIITGPYRLIGLVPFLLGGWITVWADQIFKQRGTTVKPHLDPSVLVTNGPFRISRHPMYLGMTMILFGIAILSGSIIAFISPIAFAAIVQMKFMPLEERAMRRIFGEQYTSYKERVRAWL